MSLFYLCVWRQNLGEIWFEPISFWRWKLVKLIINIIVKIERRNFECVFRGKAEVLACALRCCGSLQLYRALLLTTTWDHKHPIRKWQQGKQWTKRVLCNTNGCISDLVHVCVHSHVLACRYVCAVAVPGIDSAHKSQWAIEPLPNEGACWIQVFIPAYSVCQWDSGVKRPRTYTCTNNLAPLFSICW